MDAASAADRVGDRPLLAGGLALQAIGMGWVALIAEPGMGYGALVVPMIVAGLGGSIAIPPAASAVLRAVPAESVGAAAGANSMLRELGGVFGIALSALLAAAGALVSLALPARRPTSLTVVCRRGRHARARPAD